MLKRSEKRRLSVCQRAGNESSPLMNWLRAYRRLVCGSMVFSRADEETEFVTLQIPTNFNLVKSQEK